MNDRQDAAADALGRIFAGIDEAQRLLGAQPNAGDEAADDQRGHARSERAEEGEDAEQQQVELVDEAPPEPVGELALARGADEQAEHGGAADGRNFGSGRKLGLQEERNQRTEHREVDDVEEIAGGDERDNAPMQRRYFRVIERVADKTFDSLGAAAHVRRGYSCRHVILPMIRIIKIRPKRRHPGRRRGPCFVRVWKGARPLSMLVRQGELHVIARSEATKQSNCGAAARIASLRSQ